MRGLLREIRRIIRLNRKNLLIFEVLYRLAATVIYLWLAVTGLRFALNRAGYSYLTADNALHFLLKPVTIPMLVLLAAAGLLLVTIEIGGLVTAYAGAAYSLRLTPLDIFMGGIRKTAGEVRKKNFLILLAGFLLWFLLNLFFIGRILSHTKPFGFVMGEIAANALARAVVPMVLIVCWLIVVPSVYLFHECMMEQRSVRDAFWRSRRLLIRSWLQTGICLMGGHLLVIAGAVCLYMVGMTLTALVTLPFVSRDLELAFLMETAKLIEMVIIFFAGIAAVVIHFAIISVQYYRIGDRDKRTDFRAIMQDSGEYSKKW